MGPPSSSRTTSSSGAARAERRGPREAGRSARRARRGATRKGARNAVRRCDMGPRVRRSEPRPVELQPGRSSHSPAVRVTARAVEFWPGRSGPAAAAGQLPARRRSAWPVQPAPRTSSRTRIGAVTRNRSEGPSPITRPRPGPPLVRTAPALLPAGLLPAGLLPAGPARTAGASLPRANGDGPHVREPGAATDGYEEVVPTWHADPDADGPPLRPAARGDGGVDAGPEQEGGEGDLGRGIGQEDDLCVRRLDEAPGPRPERPEPDHGRVLGRAHALALPVRRGAVVGERDPSLAVAALDQVRVVGVGAGQVDHGHVAGIRRKASRPGAAGPGGAPGISGAGAAGAGGSPSTGGAAPSWRRTP